MNDLLRFRVKPIVDGDCYGKVVLINDYISFFGEVDPYNGVYKASGERIGGRILVFRGGRGSTVGSYIIYALKKYGNAPQCMFVEKAEPIIITGAVLADIPLFIIIDYMDFIKKIGVESIVRHERGVDYLVVEE